MKPINWNPEKNQQLIVERGVSFEDIVFYLQQGALLDDIEHPNSDKYPSQRIFVIDIDGYVHLVPYVENRKEIFLKTVIPSRKATEQYLGEKS
ncbi:MAG TPA: BrnT family toxin [Gammaproteobacteria bacterium]|nr:BrnT family toxin [Gammaproteobacteria bacterium]